MKRPLKTLVLSDLHLGRVTTYAHAPEILAPNTALTWNLNQQALNVYRVQGTSSGTGTFNLMTFTGTTGITQYWSAVNGALMIQ